MHKTKPAFFLASHFADTAVSRWLEMIYFFGLTNEPEKEVFAQL